MNQNIRTIVGVYETEQEAITAIEDLIKQGYSKEEISVIGKNLNHVSNVTEETGTAAEETAATGAITGGALGGITGLLAGIGALAIPGIGPIIAAGPIATTLMGALTGAGVGGLTGALIGLGIPDDQAKYYGNSVKEGKILVLVKQRGYPANDIEQRMPPEMEIDPTPVSGGVTDETRFDPIKERNPALSNKYF
jgi:uncharacterized membrane protein